MAKKSDITDAERELFRQAMQHIQPDSNKNDTSDSQKLPHRNRIQQQWIADGEGYFHSAGLQKRLLRQLCNGQLSIDAEIDLHGYRLHQAEDIMATFLAKAPLQQWRVIKIIHGKGWRSEAQIGKIKQWLFKWLPEQASVLAWQPAIPSDGGSGAGYVLLRI